MECLFYLNLNKINNHYTIKIFLLICTVIFILPQLCLSSNGDSSNEYQGCYHVCHFNNCTSGKSLIEFEHKRSFMDRIFGWSCEDDCKYLCMWHTTQVYQDRGRNIPQFHGKWSFIKIIGLQEPASVIFSLFNFAAHYVNYKSFKMNVPSTAPMYTIWIVYSLVCLNAWLWSTIFHARDRPFTEIMDYFCAFSMVLYSLFALAIRICGRQKEALKTSLGIIFICFFAYHVWYLSMKSFDYGYNMTVNIFIGLLNGIGWLWWCWRRRGTRHYLWWCQVTLVALCGSMMLELMDFAPFWWLFDAHSLWHLATAPLPFWWYKFIEYDCLYLMERSSLSAYRKSV